MDNFLHFLCSLREYLSLVMILKCYSDNLHNGFANSDNRAV